MAHPEVLLVVKFRSALSFEDIMKAVHERADDFRVLEGLQQKYYFKDPATGEYGGLYLWSSPAALDEYRQSALRASIADAYQVIGEPRVEVFKVIMPLRE